MNAIGLLISVLLVSFIYGHSLDVKDYLKKYGYYEDYKYTGNKVNKVDQLKEAIKKFQKTHLLNVTGQIDAKTKKLINTPRCGLSDHVSADMSGLRWNKLDLTYYFNNYTPDLSQDQVRSLTTKALKYWSDVTKLRFTEQNGHGDIVLHFGSRTHHDGRRQCGSQFDGPSGVLAHAFFPPDGRLHFDEDEHYTTLTPSGINYLWVATHELGHILGLDHDTANKNAVMYPYYRPYNPNGMQLHWNDINRIQQKYGTGTPVNTDFPPPTRFPWTTPDPGCQDVSDNCDELSAFCRQNDMWIDHMKKHCKRTCGFCGSNTQPPLWTTKIPEWSTSAPENCHDVSSNCHYLKNHCFLNDDLMDFTIRECKKTCGYCDKTPVTNLPPITNPGICVDTSINCDEFTSFCKHDANIQKFCKKTCNLC